MVNSYDVVKDLEKLLDDKTIEMFGSPSNLKTTKEAIEYVDKVRSFSR